jgi:hypothetical protein
MSRQIVKTITAAILGVVLAACGGGGGSTPASTGNSTSSGGGAITAGTQASPSSSAIGNTASSGSTATPAGNSSTVTAATFVYDETARFNGPVGVQSDAAGNLYVLDELNQRVRKIALDGSVSTVPVDLRQLSSVFAGNMEVDAVGNVYVVTSSNVIFKITPTGTLSVVATIPGARTPVMDAAGNLYVFGAGPDFTTTVRRISPAGATSTVFNGAPNVQYTGLAVDAAGNLYTVARSSNALVFQGRIMKIPANGEQTIDLAALELRIYPDDTYGRTDIANMTMDAAGNIYVAHYRQHSVSPGCGNQCQLGIYESGMAIDKMTPDRVVTRLRTGPPGSTGKLVEEHEYDSQYSMAYIEAGFDGNLYATYRKNHTVYRISQSGETTLIAGKPGEPGSSD